MSHEGMINYSSEVFTVCILAYNEEKHIARTVDAIQSGQRASFPIHVYANGCTDGTISVCQSIAEINGNLNVHELDVASKPRAWNTAFTEHKTKYVVFSDGDIVPDSGAVTDLVELLESKPDAIIATCRQKALTQGLTFQQKIVGFLQRPLHQDFLAGGFYAVRRQALEDVLRKYSFMGLPEGVTGEDCFLDRLVGPERIIIAECYSAYEPPDFTDYCRYLARLQWQNEQLDLFLPSNQCYGFTSFKCRLIKKLSYSIRKENFSIALLAVSARYIFKNIFSHKIKKSYKKIGPVHSNGAGVLQSVTRSLSAK